MARPKDLGAVLAELGGSEGLTPADLAELLGGLGVTLGVNLTGVNLTGVNPTKDEDAPLGAVLDAGTVGLDAMLEHMNADQLRGVAKRFNPNANASRVAESKKAVLEALGKPTLLDRMIAELSPLEHLLLSEAKRRGGVVDGWALIVYAALRGFEPRERGGRGSVYKHYLGSAPGVGYVSTLLRDGLLIPASHQASWFSAPYYASQEGGPDDDLLLVDPRVLARLPDDAPPPPQPLGQGPLDTVLDTVSTVTPTASHPVQGLLELFDVVGLLLEEGGLHVTQRGTVSKTLLSRLVKRRPWLEARLERLLSLSMFLGLVDAPAGSTKDPWRVNLTRVDALRNAPLPLSYAFMVEAFLHMTEASEDDAWRRPLGLVSEPVAKRALLECLEALPGSPVGLEEVLGALWARVLKYVGTPPMRRWGSDEDAKAERPVWFTGALLGAFRDLGLVAVAELPDAGRAPDEPTGGVHLVQGGPQNWQVTRVGSPSEGDTAYRYAVAPAPGLEWLARGRRLQMVDKHSAEAPPDEARLRQLLGLDPDTGEPGEPSLLIQPNFDILVYLDRLSPPAVAALSCADCARIDARTASFTLSRASLYRALEAGLDLDTLLEGLQEHSVGVPDNVARSLRDWASRRERLRVRENVTLLEYANQKERDAALEKLAGGRAVAERFVLLSAAPPPKVKVRHQYGLAPTRTLHFSPEGDFRSVGATDLAGRAVLARLAKQDVSGTYHLDVAAVRAGALTTAARDALVSRAQGGLPPSLEALLGIWEGESAAPALATIHVFQHPSAAALAKHPHVAPHLGAALNETSYLVREGHEAELNESLTDLGAAPAKGFETGLKAQTVQGGVMQTGLDTRKMRVMIEAAVAQGKGLELRYHQEKIAYNGYGYSKKSKGKVVTEKVVPESVQYSGSTPYLAGETVGGGENRYIRIGYITGIAVL